MLRVWQLYGDNSATPFGLSCWILVFFGLQLFLSQVRAPSATALRTSGMVWSFIRFYRVLAGSGWQGRARDL